MARSIIVALLVGWLASAVIAAEPIQFPQPLNVSAEREKIVQAFATATAQTKDPSDPAYQAALAARDDALSQLAAAAESTKSTEHAALTQVFLALKRYDDAARAAQAAVDSNAADWSSRFVHISVLCQVNRPDEVVAAFGQLTALDIPVADAKTYLRDVLPVATSVVNRLTEVGKFAEAERAIDAWRAQLGRLEPHAPPELRKDFSGAKMAAMKLSGSIAVTPPTLQQPPSPPPTRNSGDPKGRVQVSEAELAAQRAAQARAQTLPKGQASNLSTEALKAARAGQRDGAAATPAEIVRPMRAADRSGPSATDAPPDEQELKSKRAAQARMQSLQPRQFPAQSAEALKAARAGRGESETPSLPKVTNQARAADRTEPTDRAGHSAPNSVPSEQEGAAPQNAKAQIPSARPSLTPTPPVKASSAFEAARRAAAAAAAARGRTKSIPRTDSGATPSILNVATQLKLIKAEFSKTPPPVPDISSGPSDPKTPSSHGEESLRAQQGPQGEQSRRVAQYNKAKVDFAAALTELAIAAEAAHCTEHAALAEVYSLLDRQEDSAREAQVALNENPADNATRALLVKSLFGLGRQDDALREARAALEHNPADFRAHAVLLRLLCDLKRANEVPAAAGAWLNAEVPASDVGAYLISFRGNLSQTLIVLREAGNDLAVTHVLTIAARRLEKLQSQLGPTSPHSRLVLVEKGQVEEWVEKFSTKRKETVPKPRRPKQSG